MKLRIRGSSLRLRLTKTEVSTFAGTGKVEEIVDFGGERTNRFIYALERISGTDSVCAEFENGRICVYIPEEKAREWTGSDLIGFESNVNDLQILVEKDFACTQLRAGEDESDMFANPTAALCG